MNQRLRVAVLSPIAWRTPPRQYGPWEQVASNTAEGLTARGHDVTLFATADSFTAGTLEAVCPAPYEEDPEIDPKVWECLHIAHLMERAGRFDIIHNHYDFLPLTYSRLIRTPVVTTIHGFSSPKIVPVYEAYNDRVAYISISDSDRHPALRYEATVYNGIRTEDFTFRPEPGAYLVYFGRIHPDKGTAEAIRIASAFGMPLVISGIVQDREYFAAEVEPHLDGRRIWYIGPSGPRQRDELLGGAYALLHPIAFEEPFGLSVAEAMLCGTPTIAYRRGSMPELISDGATGFLVENAEEAVVALRAVPGIDRSGVRREAERRFSVEAMISGYLEVYRRVLGLQCSFTELLPRN